MEPFAARKSSSASEKRVQKTLTPTSDEVLSRLTHIFGITNDPRLSKVIKHVKAETATLDEVSNCLMAIFRDRTLVEAYSLLYELNYKQFLMIIFNKIKYYCHLLDPKDILQDVFLSIYRYPNRFREEKTHAFRNWSYSIIRNTILKHLKMRETHEISSDSLLEIIEDPGQEGPLNKLVRKEGMRRFKERYLFFLILYLNIVNNFLSEREQRALQLVEVEDKRYREASDILGIKLENFKMVVCRARKKIIKHMNQMLGEDSP